MSEKPTPMTDMADQALKQYNEALRTGLRFQEAATRWWSTMLTPPAAVPEWPQRLSNLIALTNGVFPLAQGRMEEVMDWMTENSRTGNQLVQQALAAAQTPNPMQSQAKWMEFWMTSLSALRSNVQAATQLNTRTLDAWLGFTRTATAQSQNPKAA